MLEYMFTMIFFYNSTGFFNSKLSEMLHLRSILEKEVTIKRYQFMNDHYKKMHFSLSSGWFS